MHQYKVVEDNKDTLDVVIEKSGISHTFTIRDFNENIASAKRQITEIESMKKVAEATMVNVLGSDPEVGELSERTLTAVYVYRQAMGTAHEAQKKLIELQSAIEEDEKSVAEALEQTGLVIPKAN